MRDGGVADDATFAVPFTTGARAFHAFVETKEQALLNVCASLAAQGRWGGRFSGTQVASIRALNLDARSTCETLVFVVGMFAATPCADAGRVVTLTRPHDTGVRRADSMKSRLEPSSADREIENHNTAGKLGVVRRLAFRSGRTRRYLYVPLPLRRYRP